METTPNDLRQQQFEIKFRGYNPDDVEVFRDLAATALEEARADGLKLSEENNHLNERLKHLIELEDTLKAAVMEAQKNADGTVATAKKEAVVTVEQANKEAELIIREAQQRKSEIVSGMHQQMGKLVADINKIRYIRSNYLIQFKSMITSQLASIEQLLTEDEKDNKHGDSASDYNQKSYDDGISQQYTAEEMQSSESEEVYKPENDSENESVETREE